MKVYIVKHVYGWDYESDYFKLEAAYTTKENAELHVKAIYNKLIEYESKHKRIDVTIDENGVGCYRLERPNGIMYGYDEWNIEELEISEKPDFSKIEL